MNSYLDKDILHLRQDVDSLDRSIDFIATKMDVLMDEVNELKSQRVYTHLTPLGQASVMEWADDFRRIMRSPFDANANTPAMECLNGQMDAPEIPLMLQECMLAVFRHDRRLNEMSMPEQELEKLKNKLADALLDVELMKTALTQEMYTFKDKMKGSLLAEARASFGLNKTTIEKVASIKRKTV